MDIIKAFKLNENNYNLNVQGTYKDPLFKAVDIQNILEMENIKNLTRDLEINKEKKIVEIKTNGGKQKIMFLTKDGLYKILNRSRKPNAKKFQDWIMSVINEIRDTGNYNEKEDNEVDIEFRKGRKENNLELLKIRNDTLIETMKKKKVVYLTQIRDYNEDGKRIIKIGSSDDISIRNPQLKRNFGESILLNVFEVNRHSDFEKYLHKHSEISPLQYNEPINEQNSREMFLLDDKMFERLLFIIQHEIKKFHDLTHEQLIEIKNIENESNKTKLELKKQMFELKKLKNEKLKLENEKLKLEIEKLKQKQNTNEYNLGDKLEEESEQYLKKEDEDYELVQFLEEDEEEDDEDDEEEEEIDICLEKKNDTNTENKNTQLEKYNGEINKKKSKKINGGIIQQYDPNTFKLIRSYQTLIDITRRDEFKDCAESSFKRATKVNNIYAGYRWFEIKREQEDIEYNIPQTVNIKQSKRAYIAQIDLYKTKILEVYSSQKTAAEKLGGNIGSICRAINDTEFKHQASSSYWRFFDDCPTIWKTEFLKNNNLPDKEIVINGQKRVQQIDPVTREIIKTYNSQAEVKRLFEIGPETIKKCSKNNTIHKNFIWKIIG